MASRKIDLVFIAGLIAGVSYFFGRDLALPAWVLVAWKGTGVGLFAVWAASQARGVDGWWIAVVLALGATGDVLIEDDLIRGAIAFLAGHVVAIPFYLKHRRGSLWIAAVVAVAVAAIAWVLPDQRGDAPGIALYAFGLGLMAGTALISRFPFSFVGIGALLFIVSDLLLFARMGPLGGSPIPDWLVWPTYLGGQALIAWGVVDSLRRERSEPLE